MTKNKVAIQYRIVSDYKKFNRSLYDVINIIDELNADFVFQAWLTQQPLPNSCNDLPVDMIDLCNNEGYSYEYLRDSVSIIKEEIPNVELCGGTQIEYLYPEEVGGIDIAWSMALDPSKWGINFSKVDMQCLWAKLWNFVDDKVPCPDEQTLKETMSYYFPDVTNTNFINVFLNRIYKQIDAGIDSIWIDMLYVQPNILLQLTGDPNHQSVVDSYKAIWNIVDKIHSYGKMYNKNINVISWVTDSRGSLLTTKTNLDMCAITPTSDEVRNRLSGKIADFDDNKWDIVFDTINKTFKIPIYARIDYSNVGRTPLYVMSQELSVSESKDFIEKADKYFTDRGAVFIYPVHGGIMGSNPSKLSYGMYNWYDSLAPEFNTYSKIKELANDKVKKKHQQKE